MANTVTWIRTYSQVLDGAIPQCPSCRSSRVKLVLIANGETRMGFGFIWCEHCLEGMHISRLQVPLGASFIPIDQAASEWTLPEGIRLVES
jgi:hypothetical protein